MKRAAWLHLRLLLCLGIPVLATACSSAGVTLEAESSPGPTTKFPANVGYLRAAHPSGGRLVIFNGDTFEVYRSVDLPPSTHGRSHRLEIGPAGRIWLGYSQVGIDHITKFGPGARDRVLVFSPDGVLEHELDVGCSPPDTGIAFANGYAFVACAASGFYGKVVVMDTATMEIVKTFDKVHPPGNDVTQSSFYITTVEKVAGFILVMGYGNPPRDYESLTHYAGAFTRVGVIDPETLTIRGYLKGLEPGLRVLSVLEVDGKAWLFNELSHLEERPPRTDVYVMDPQAVEIVDRFNLERPFPKWAEHGDGGSIHIYHVPQSHKMADAGYPTGITRLDLETGLEFFTSTPSVPNAFGLGVFRDRPCLTHRGLESGGLWCMNDEGVMERKVPQEYAVGVQFRPAGAAHNAHTP